MFYSVHISLTCLINYFFKMLIICLIFWVTAIPLSIEAAPFYIPTSDNQCSSLSTSSPILVFCFSIPADVISRRMCSVTFLSTFPGRGEPLFPLWYHCFHLQSSSSFCQVLLHIHLWSIPTPFSLSPPPSPAHPSYHHFSSPTPEACLLACLFLLPSFIHVIAKGISHW